MLDRHGIAPSEAAFLGDDFPDMAVLKLVGLPVAVANAVPEVCAVCAHTLTRRGGAGAAGSMAAIFAAASGADVVLLERTRDGGRKILISGGGRCNVLPSVRRNW